jgi:hypothetical protein
MASTILDATLPPVGKFHFLKVGAWVHVFSIDEQAMDEIASRTSGILDRCSHVFNRLSPENKAALVSGLLKTAVKLGAFDQLKNEDAKEKKVQKALRLGPNMILESLGERWGDTALRVISGVAEHQGISFEKASAQLRKSMKMMRLIVATHESPPKKPNPQVRTLRQDAETLMLRALLAEAEVKVIESGNDAYGWDPGLILMGILTVWTSGKRTRPDTMRKRLAAVRKRGYGENFPTGESLSSPILANSR